MLTLQSRQPSQTLTVVSVFKEVVYFNTVLAKGNLTALCLHCTCVILALCIHCTCVHMHCASGVHVCVHCMHLCYMYVALAYY